MFYLLTPLNNYFIMGEIIEYELALYRESPYLTRNFDDEPEQP